MLFERKIQPVHIMSVERWEYERRGTTPGEFLDELRTLLPDQAIIVDFSAVEERDRLLRMRTYREAVSHETRCGRKTFSVAKVDMTLVAARI